jgi:hypothetical protein
VASRRHHVRIIVATAESTIVLEKRLDHLHCTGWRSRQAGSGQSLSKAHLGVVSAMDNGLLTASLGFSPMSLTVCNAGLKTQFPIQRISAPASQTSLVGMQSHQAGCNIRRPPCSAVVVAVHHPGLRLCILTSRPKRNPASVVWFLPPSFMHAHFHPAFCIWGLQVPPFQAPTCASQQHIIH